VGKRQGKKRTTGRERERMREREASSGRPYPRVRSIGGGAHHCKGSGDGQLATELFDRGRKTTTVSWAWAVGGLLLLGCGIEGTGQREPKRKEREEKPFWL
jgi:hypothetical protein